MKNGGWVTCEEKDPTCDKIPPRNNYRSDKRAAVLHALFSHLEEEPVDEGERPAAFRAWLESWIGKNHEFKGTCNSQVILKYLKKHVAPRLDSGGVLVLDNAKEHKEFVQDFNARTADWIHNFIVERETPGEGQQLFEDIHNTLDSEGN